MRVYELRLYSSARVHSEINILLSDTTIVSWT